MHSRIVDIENLMVYPLQMLFSVLALFTNALESRKANVQVAKGSKCESKTLVMFLPSSNLNTLRLDDIKLCYSQP
jgi:hypothetical protein